MGLTVEAIAAVVLLALLLIAVALLAAARTQRRAERNERLDYGDWSTDDQDRVNRR